MSELLDPQTFRTVLEGLPTGIYLVDLNRKILFWNHGAEKISGFLAQEVIGRCCRDGILGHCNAEECSVCERRCPLQETMRDGKPRQAELYLRHKQGHRVAVRVRAVPLRNASGAIVGAAESFDEHCFSGEHDQSANGPEASDLFSRATGLPSQAITLGVYKQALDTFKKQLVPFSLLRIHIDHLTRFQADHGVEATDELLKVLAHTARNSLPPGDFMGCWTGREFVAIVTCRHRRLLAKIGERLRSMVSNSGITWWGDRVTLTVSIGGAVVKTGDTAESLLDRASLALNSCMKSGGNCVLILKDEFSGGGPKGNPCL